MSCRAVWPGLFCLLAGCAAAFGLLTACQDDGAAPRPAQAGPPIEQPADEPDAPPSEAEAAEAAEATEAPVRTLEINCADVGAHLQDTEHRFPLSQQLASAGDAFLEALPGRAYPPSDYPPSGLLCSNSADSLTGETFWLEVFTENTSPDEPPQLAAEAVAYLAEEPSRAGFILPSGQNLFRASSRSLGDHSVLIELYHGHSGICLLTQLAVFAQGYDLLFLRNAIEVTRESSAAAAPAAVSFESKCDASKAARQLTDLDAVARLIAERLAAAP